MHLSWRGPGPATGGFLPEKSGRQQPQAGSARQRDVRLSLAGVQVLSPSLSTPTETNQERRAVIMLETLFDKLFNK